MRHEERARTRRRAQRHVRLRAYLSTEIGSKLPAQMSSFEQVRSTRIAAPPATVHALVADLHTWTKWSPWEELDADLKRTYGGAEKGVGARYEWAGKKAGEGSMRITHVTDDRIELDLDFVKPFKANNRVVFRFERDENATRVTWSRSGTRNMLLAVLGKLFFDRMIGKDFDKGLARPQVPRRGVRPEGAGHARQGALGAPTAFER